MSVPFSNTKLRVPRGFQSILEGLSREVLRTQPADIHAFGAAYFEKLLKVRAESGVDPTVKSAQLEDRFYNNKAFEKPDIDTSSHEQQDAAVAIQTKYRQHHASQVVQDKREDKAAIKIQAGFRGYQDRRRVKQLKDKKTSKEGEAAEDEIDIDLDDPEVEAAAVKIQAGFKNYKSRQAVKTDVEPAAPGKQEEIDIDMDDPEVQKAATKIQAGFKGYKARKDADILKHEKEVKPEPGEEEGQGDAERKDVSETKEEKADEIDIDLDDPEVEAAAVKIQASFKSFKARKESHAAADDAEGVTEEGTKEERAKEGEAEAKGEEEIDIDLNDPEVEAAAVKIQASYKGFKSRKESRVTAEGDTAGDAEAEKEGDAKDDAEEVKKPEEEEIDIDLTDPEVEKAAEKIQASYKGFKARKSLKETTSDDTEQAEVETEVKGETEGEVKGETEDETKAETEGEVKGETEGEVKGETEEVKGETEGAEMKDEAEDPAKE